MEVGEVVKAILGIIALIFILSVIIAFPTMLLWNWLMPVIFGLPKVTFLQAFGINLLSNVLFKNTSTKTS